MLTKNQEKLIKSLHTKKGRKESGLCLVEGGKNIETAEQFLEFTFTDADSKNFEKLITTETPQNIAAIARIPKHDISEISKNKIVVVLDGVQDPGNVGTVLRLAFAMTASVILVESADPSNPKAIRASAGSFFQTPWIQMNTKEVTDLISQSKRQILRLEKRKNATDIKKITPGISTFLIAGSEGHGITLPIKGESVYIPHNASLESLNVASALAIALWELSK